MYINKVDTYLEYIGVLFVLFMMVYITIIMRLNTLEIYLSEDNKTPEAISQKLCCLRLVKFFYILFLFAFITIYTKMNLYNHSDHDDRDTRTDLMWLAASLLQVMSCVISLCVHLFLYCMGFRILRLIQD